MALYETPQPLGLADERFRREMFGMIPEGGSYLPPGLRDPAMDIYRELQAKGLQRVEPKTQEEFSAALRGPGYVFSRDRAENRPVSDIRRAYGQALEEVRGLQPMVLPETTGDPRKDWQAARDVYAQVINKGQQLGKTPEEIQAELKFRGVDKIDLYTPPVVKQLIPIDIGGIKYNVTPEQYAEIEKTRKEGKEGKAAETISVGGKVKQWNPASKSYDIDLGPVTISPEKTMKMEEKAERAKIAQAGALSKAKLIAGKADKAIGQTGTTTAGWLGTILGKIPGTPARDLRRTIDTIKANLGFEELREMKAASPTGGALGQVTERELEMLQATLDSLEQDQSPAQLNEALTAVKDTFMKVKNSIEAYEKGGAQPGAAATGEGTPSPEGARQAPDGKWYVSDPNRPGKYLEVR